MVLTTSSLFGYVLDFFSLTTARTLPDMKLGWPIDAKATGNFFFALSIFC